MAAEETARAEKHFFFELIPRCFLVILAKKVLGVNFWR